MRLNYPPEYRGVINSIRRKANRLGIKIRVGIGRTVHTDDNDTTGTAGYYADKELAIAVGKKFEDWILIFLHESCHMDQWADKRLKDKIPVWDKDLGNFFAWLEGIAEFNRKQVEKFMSTAIEVELDCERRTVQKIIEWGLPLDTVDYIKKANTYLFGYHLVKQKRKWYVDVYNQEEVWTKAPDDFCKDYTVVPAKLQRAFDLFLSQQQNKQHESDT